jgi:glycerol-3-phosphate dehydrogenase
MIRWRQTALAALERETFDVIVVGGGINGAGIARDAALRGMRVAVLEQGDFASGTSSRSSKLIHGGLRYLEQGHLRLVLEAARERERLRRLAPHLVRPMRFVFPLYAGVSRPPWMIGIGLWGYDLLAGVRSVKRHRMLSPGEVAQVEPGLRRDGLRGAGEYWDCWTNDARLVLETMLSAVEAGAVALSYAEVVGFEKDAGRIVGVRLRDAMDGTALTVRGRVVVNAAGPWVDRVRALDDAAAPPRLRLTKGVHVVVERARIGHEAALVLQALRDRRVMFVIPWGGHSLVGTTDTDHAGGPETLPTVEPSDVGYLLETVNHYFPHAALAPGDVVSAFAGLRPLVAPPPGTREKPSEVSREEDIFTSAAGLVTICGGKLTTHRLIAAKVVDRVVSALRSGGGRRRFGASPTAGRPLPGGTVAPETLADDLAARDGHGMGLAVLRHLAGRYGRRVADVLGAVARDHTLAAPILPGLPDPRAEVVTAVEHEWAVTLEDVLRRRTQVALFDPTQGGTVAADVAALMAPSLGWTADTSRAAAETYAAATAAERRRWR